MLQQLGSRGTGLAQGRHQLRDDLGIESVFLPRRPERYPYRLRRDAKAGRDKGESACLSVCLPDNAWSKPCLLADLMEPIPVGSPRHMATVYEPKFFKVEPPSIQAASIDPCISCNFFSIVFITGGLGDSPAFFIER